MTAVAFTAASMGLPTLTSLASVMLLASAASTPGSAHAEAGKRLCGAAATDGIRRVVYAVEVPTYSPGVIWFTFCYSSIDDAKRALNKEGLRNNQISYQDVTCEKAGDYVGRNKANHDVCEQMKFWGTTRNAQPAGGVMYRIDASTVARAS